MDRSAAIGLLYQHVKEEPLRKHCLATGAIMKALAGPMGGDPVLWEEIGILHDIDFEEVHGDMQKHGVSGAAILRSSGVSDDVAGPVARHNHLLHGASYTAPLDIALQAADSASGLVIACALVKGGNLGDVSVRTITKKAKEKSFAAGCDRNRIALIAPLMELPVFYDRALSGMMEIRQELGL
ncbi:MAG: HDIG domain-containing protein [Methanomicrobiales archaeon]|nr:HDIG domain-containing protein [Methanomicrobiales archaeon]